MTITAERVREVLSYDPETGELTWIKQLSNRNPVGNRAGVICKQHGYRIIGIDKKTYHAARLAFLWMMGRWPGDRVDHINMDRSDDRWCNLREATHSQNLANTRRWSHNSSGFKGVHLHRQNGKWRARITRNKRHISLGLYDTPEEAHAAYCAAAAEFYGDFARTG